MQADGSSRKSRSARDAAEFIIRKLRDSSFEALLAGGCVRDMILNIPPKDYDVATDAPPDSVARIFNRTQSVGAQFGVTLVAVWNHQIEVATFRTDGNYRDGRHPERVTFGHARDDALRRDFTINGMFYDIDSTQIVDYVGGRDDLSAKLIRAIGDPRKRFDEDHLRMLRAVRFATRLGFSIEQSTLSAIREHASQLARISTERVRDELTMILGDARRADGWECIIDCNLADHIMPRVSFDPARHTVILNRLRALPAMTGFPAVLACLVGWLDLARAESVCREFTSPNSESRAVRWLIENRARIQQPEQLELADVKMLANDERFEMLCDLSRADLIAQGASTKSLDGLLQRVADIDPRDIAPSPYVTGQDLIERAVPKGPIYRRLLDEIYRAQLNNDVTSRSEALQRLESFLAAKRNLPEHPH
jgi:poly(A) polymerase